LDLGLVGIITFSDLEFDIVGAVPFDLEGKFILRDGGVDTLLVQNLAILIV